MCFGYFWLFCDFSILRGHKSYGGRFKGTVPSPRNGRLWTKSVISSRRKDIPPARLLANTKTLKSKREPISGGAFGNRQAQFSFESMMRIHKNTYTYLYKVIYAISAIRNGRLWTKAVVSSRRKDIPPARSLANTKTLKSKREPISGGAFGNRQGQFIFESTMCIHKHTYTYF